MDALKQFWDDITTSDVSEKVIFKDRPKKSYRLKVPYEWDNHDTQLINKVNLDKVDAERIEMVKSIIRYYKNNKVMSDKGRLVLLRQLVVQNKIHNNLNFKTSTVDEFIEVLVNAKVLYKLSPKEI